MQNSIGIVGLGKMGSRIAAKLTQGGVLVHVWNRSYDATKVFLEKNTQAKGYEAFTDFVDALGSQKIIWCMVPAGDATQTIFETTLPLVSAGDIFIDAGNANFQDTERRAKIAKEKGLLFLGIGVSGGIVAETNGYPVMVGGDREAYEMLKPFLDILAKPNGGHAYFGTGGAGHFVKMIHNGIEYGIMQSLAEGFDVLKNSSYAFDLAHVSQLWQKGTLVSGFLLDRVTEVLQKDQTLDTVVGSVAASGEAKWTVDVAKVQKINVPIIEASLEFRLQSQQDKVIQQSFTAKLLAAMRNAFGGHDVVKK